jgi:hypothetical protein
VLGEQFQFPDGRDGSCSSCLFTSVHSSTSRLELERAFTVIMLLRIDNLTVPEIDPLYLSLSTEPCEVKCKGRVFDRVLVTFGHDGDVKAASSFRAMSKLHCALRLVQSTPTDSSSYSSSSFSALSSSSSSEPVTYLVVEDMKRYISTIVAYFSGFGAHLPVICTVFLEILF